MSITDKNFADWHAAYFGYGYGSGEEFWIPALYDLFLGDHLLPQGRYDHSELEKAFGGLAAWLLINTLCGANVFEYGTSPRFGWLTPQGEMLRDYFRSQSLDRLVEISSAVVEDICLSGWCNCTMTTEPCNPLFKRGHES